MQVTETAAQYNYSPFKCLYENLLHAPSNLYIGLNACLVREIPGTMIYFVGYRGSARLLTHFFENEDVNMNNNNDNTDNSDNDHVTGNREKKKNYWIILPSGSIGGVAFWTVMYPVDLIKSKIQTQMMKKSHNNVIGQEQELQLNSNNLTVWRMLNDRYKQYGFRSLYAGYSLVALRSTIFGAILFGSYEYCRQALHNAHDKIYSN